MFKAFSRSFFFAGVQAELKAQHNDQGFVERVCQGEDGANYFNKRLDRWRDLSSGIKPAKVRFFIMTCGVLGDRLICGDLAKVELNLCAKLLSDRCARILSSPELLSLCKRDIAVWIAEIKRHTAENMR